MDTKAVSSVLLSFQIMTTVGETIRSLDGVYTIYICRAGTISLVKVCVPISSTKLQN